MFALTSDDIFRGGSRAEDRRMPLSFSQGKSSLGMILPKNLDVSRLLVF